ncbi:MAG: DUF222 domain-containing protein [Nocardioidaceae bacterium]
MVDPSGGSGAGFGWAQVRSLGPGATLTAALESRPLGGLDDAELVDAMAGYKRLANACESQILAAMAELDARRAAGPTRDCRDGRDITSRSQTATEVAAATRESEYRSHQMLHTATTLGSDLPATAALLAAGRISGYQAHLIAVEIDKLVDTTLTPAVEATIIAVITADNTGVTAEIDLVAATTAEIRTIAQRTVAEAEPDQHEKRHKRAYTDRVLTRRPGEDGMATLTLHHSSIVVDTIYHRLGLIARNTHEADDRRTLDQRVADLAAGLLSGQTVPVTTPTSALEDGAAPALTNETHGAPAARVNITLSLATLMGFSDRPSRLQDGQTIPACIARQIANQPNSVWYRLLTDDTGRMLELSARGYRPGAALTRSVQAEHPVCVQIGCRHPAHGCESDHETPWPTGATTLANLSPKCPRHHRGKTAGHFHSHKDADGTNTWTYPTGHTYARHPPRHPLNHWPDDWVEPESLTHIQAGLAALEREQARKLRARIDRIEQQILDRRLARWCSRSAPDPEPIDPAMTAAEMTDADLDALLL